MGEAGHRFLYNTGLDARILYISSLEGDMEALPGHYVIKGTEGEFYPCKETVFKRKYYEKKEESDEG